MTKPVDKSQLDFHQWEKFTIDIVLPYNLRKTCYRCKSKRMVMHMQPDVNESIILWRCIKCTYKRSFS